MRTKPNQHTTDPPRPRPSELASQLVTLVEQDPNDREFWLDVRRGLLQVVRAIERRHGVGATARR